MAEGLAVEHEASHPALQHHIVNTLGWPSLRPTQVQTYRRTVGFVFQDFRLIPRFTVFQNVAFVMRVLGVASVVHGTPDALRPRRHEHTGRLHQIRRHLKHLACPLIGDVRGMGMMIGVEFVKDKAGKKEDPELRERVETACFERGLIILGCGVNAIRWSPPLIITKENIDVALEIFDEAIASRFCKGRRRSLGSSARQRNTRRRWPEPPRIVQ